MLLFIFTDRRKKSTPRKRTHPPVEEIANKLADQINKQYTHIAVDSSEHVEIPEEILSALSSEFGGMQECSFDYLGCFD
jgi:hypothetical protein